MKASTKKTTAIVGVSVLSLGLVIGTGFAANAATSGIAGALHQTASVTPTSTPTPIRTHGPRGNDANDNDANDDNGRDATEHATPEPGDDDTPGTPDHHGDRAGHDDGDGHHGANRGPGKAPAPAPAPDNGSGHDGSGHDANDND